MLVISPHLDDAVFSCGALLASVRRAKVVTICAGVPPEDTPPSQFDEAAGFTTGAEAIRARRAEDLAACAVLGVEVEQMDLLSDEYDRITRRRARREITVGPNPARHRTIVDAVRAILRDTDELVIAPLGLRHPDHEIIAHACMPHPGCAFYEELPYRVLWPEFTAPALRKAGHTIQLVGLGFLHDEEARAIKARAVECYASQLLGMDTHALLADEVYHRVQP